MGTARPSPGVSTDVGSVCTDYDHSFLYRPRLPLPGWGTCNWSLLPYRAPLPGLAHLPTPSCCVEDHLSFRLLRLHWSAPLIGPRFFCTLCLLFLHFPLPQLGQIQNCAGLGTHLNYCLVPVTKIPIRNTLKKERPASVPRSRRFQLVAAVECHGGVSRHSGPGNRTICSQRSLFKCPLLLLTSLLFLKVPQPQNVSLWKLFQSQVITQPIPCVYVLFLTLTNRGV